jgi:TM2 domain-containing membrane protein YozV
MERCPNCGAGLQQQRAFCSRCGSAVTSNAPAPAPAPAPAEPAQPAERVVYVERPGPQPVVGTKNKYVALALAWLLGSLGAHKFYLDSPGWGVAYLLFCWTYIPALVAFIEGIVYLTTSDEDFARKYG